jgi:hypothetical protein
MSGSRISLSICVALALLSASCKQGDDPKPVAPQGLKSVKPEVQLPIVDDVYGAMYSIKISETINGQETKSESASAVFYEVPSNTATATQLTNAGFVAINQYNLNQGDDNEYVRTAVQGGIIPDLNYDNGITWYIEGEDGIPPVTFSWSSKFPEYAGTFPAAFSRNADLIFTFDNSTLSSFTDSVFVTISAGDKMIIKRYGAEQGKVTIPSSELIQLQACPADNPGYLQISAGVVDIFNLLAGNPTLLVKQQCDTRTVVIY